jgi:GTP1/Obg family GTP-binding protein
MDKEKIDREVKEQEELDKEFERKKREKEEKIKNGEVEKIEEYQEEFNSICYFFIFILKFSDSL